MFNIYRSAIPPVTGGPKSEARFTINALLISTHSPIVRSEEIFAGYFDVQKKIGTKAMAEIPYGAIAIWTFADKRAGLQQLMAGARKFSMPEISRDDLMAGNRETEQELGIPS